ncbi:MAG: hypothetical protein EOM47_09390 [Bacteroidia bacterium]|nr:hypothetical protein [Bacteroidia bacterium]
MNSHYKDTKYQTETQILFDYLQNYVCTATMATAATGIVQKSICRYKRTLEKMGLLYVVDFKPCPLTGFKAQWITTNPFLFPKSESNIQLSLFEKGLNDGL